MNNLFLDAALSPFDEFMYRVGDYFPLIIIGSLVLASMVAAGVIIAVIVSKKKRK